MNEFLLHGNIAVLAKETNKIGSVGELPDVFKLKEDKGVRE